MPEVQVDRLSESRPPCDLRDIQQGDVFELATGNLFMRMGRGGEYIPPGWEIPSPGPDRYWCVNLRDGTIHRLPGNYLAFPVLSCSLHVRTQHPK